MAAAEPVRRLSTPGIVLAALAIVVAVVARTIVVAGTVSAGLVVSSACVIAVSMASLRAIDAGKREVTFALIGAHLVAALWLSWIAASAAPGGPGFLATMPVMAFGVLASGLRLGSAIGVVVLFTNAVVDVLHHETGNTVVGRMMGLGAAVVFVLAFSQVMVRERLARERVQSLLGELEAAHERLRAHAAEVEELSTARERVRIAREIHDGVGHGLTVVNVQMEAARALLGADTALDERAERARSAIEKAQRVAREALNEVRRSVGMLRSQGAVGPLPDRIAALVTEYGESASFAVEGAPRGLSPAAELLLVRAAQEALTNARKHAAATRVTVRLVFGADATTLAVVDDGKGSDEASGGFGLVGMRERAALLGADVTIDTASGKGFALEVKVPA